MKQVKMNMFLKNLEEMLCQVDVINGRLMNEVENESKVLEEEIEMDLEKIEIKMHNLESDLLYKKIS